MNREQKRNFVKKATKKGMDKKLAKTFAESVGSIHSDPQDIEEGTKVKINIDLVKSRKNYANMSEKYKEFVESSTDQVFTAHIERRNLISFVEEPKWLFWSGDLLVQKSAEEM